MPDIQLDGHTISYQIQASQRAKRVSLKMAPDYGLQVVVPAALTLANHQIEDLLQRKKAWILRYWLRYPQMGQPPKRDFITGEQLLYLGQQVQLELLYKSQGKQVVIQGLGGEGTLRIALPQAFQTEQDFEAIASALENWYWQSASDHILPRTAALASLYGFAFQKASIRDQKTRWGSCSSKRNLNFNWRLIMAPPAVIDYIILHELCHLKHLNHSRRFWQLVEKHCPGYQQYETWLKNHQAMMRIR
jgi:hypothetical protein